MLVSGPAGGPVDWSQLPVYLGAQVLGGLLAGQVYMAMNRLRTIAA
jgi:glycerol uptake facilitator-like aquaporin